MARTPGSPHEMGAPVRHGHQRMAGRVGVPAVQQLPHHPLMHTRQFHHSAPNTGQGPLSSTSCMPTPGGRAAVGAPRPTFTNARLNNMHEQSPKPAERWRRNPRHGQDKARPTHQSNNQQTAGSTCRYSLPGQDGSPRRHPANGSNIPTPLPMDFGGGRQYCNLHVLPPLVFLL